MKWFNATKGFGFIAPNDESEEVFVHQSALDMGGFRSLWEVRAKLTGETNRRRDRIFDLSEVCD